MPAASKQSNLVAGLHDWVKVWTELVCSWITLRHCLSYDFRVLCCYCCSGSIYYSYYIILFMTVSDLSDPSRIPLGPLPNHSRTPLGPVSGHIQGARRLVEAA